MHAEISNFMAKLYILNFLQKWRVFTGKLETDAIKILENKMIMPNFKNISSIKITNFFKSWNNK